MQEDNWSKRLAESLRKQQEDSPLPYEPGAWEAFDKRRKKGVISPLYYWMSGVAASIALVFMIGYGLLSPEEKADQIASSQEPIEQLPSEIPSLETEKVQPEKVDASSSELLADVTKPLPSFKAKAGNATSEKVISKEKVQIASSKPSSSASTTEQMETIASERVNPPLVVLEEKVVSEQQSGSQPETKSPLVSMTEEEAKAKLMAQIGEELREETGKERRVSSVILGFGPGFGSSTQNNVATSGSNLGLGVAYDMNLGKKLALGSGLGLNYLNQSSQSQDYAQVAGFASAVQETQQVQQVQVDIPLYVRYPVTRDNSISLQAGFSNLITFNQEAEQVVSFTRQVYVADAMNVSANASTLKTEQLSLASDLIVPSQRFFPLATANLGVNIRVYESPKTSYLVMPFYNYPIQDISGTGQNPGVVGAAFKVRFGANKK
ncbi:hypothetical protein ACFPIK_04575 [Algoriphagus aquatilis]|uniref:Outer membrane protein beta-barrel domain-containing protein n=1 Tax=Algoriphagus aquatilis TaxID=490186 RepID=A0ABW0BU16_9BACT